MSSRCIALVIVIALVAVARADAQLLIPPASEPLATPSAAELDATSTPWTPPTTLVPPQAAAVAPAAQAPDEVLPAPADAGKSADLVGEAAVKELVLEPEARWYERAFSIVPRPWDTNVELGVNGSSGTSDSFSMRTGFATKRESKFSKLDTSLYYNRTGSGGDITQNNAQFDFRNDWLLDEKSPWTLFGQNSEFYDQFKDFDFQMNVDAGIGYRFYHEKDLTLIGRVGGGISREFGGVDDRWVPESLFGAEYSQQLNATQKLYAKVDYFPEWDQVGEFRLVADTGWEVVLVQPSNLSLKISATDRYDSTPNGAEPQLLNYSVLLLLKL